MKHLNILSFATLTVASTFATEALLLYEPFDYPVGSTGETSHAGDHSFAGTASPELGGVVLGRGGINYEGTLGVLSAGSLSFSGLPETVGQKAAFREAGGYNSGLSWEFGSALPEKGSYFLSFLFRMDELGGMSVEIPSGAADTWFRLSNSGRRWEGAVRRNATDPETFDVCFGLRTGSENFSPQSSGLEVGQTYFVVVEVDYATDKARMWVNPEGLGAVAPPAPAIDAKGPGAGRPFDSVAFFTNIASGTDTVEISQYTIDELRVGKTWASVTPIAEE